MEIGYNAFRSGIWIGYGTLVFVQETHAQNTKCIKYEEEELRLE